MRIARELFLHGSMFTRWVATLFAQRERLSIISLAHDTAQRRWRTSLNFGNFVQLQT
jgi:hypothetical protein